MTDRILTIRMNDKEYEALQKDAENEGISISSYCRKLIGFEAPTSLTQIRIELSELHDDVSCLAYENEMMMNMLFAMYLKMKGLEGEDGEKEIEEVKKKAAEKCIRRRVVYDASLDPFMTNDVEDAIDKIFENRKQKQEESNLEQE